jgi:hypothetical protein
MARSREPYWVLGVVACVGAAVVLILLATMWSMMIGRMLRRVHWIVAGALLVSGATVASARPSASRGPNPSGPIVHSANGGWSAPVIAIPNVGGFTTPHLIVAPDGVGYVAVSGSGSDLVGARIAPDGTVSPAEQIAPASENPHHLGLGIAADGTVTAAYTVGTVNLARVDVRERPVDGPFAAPQQISPTGTTATLVAFKETNDGFAAALLCLRDQRHCTYAVYVRRPGGATFARAASLPAGSTLAVLGAASGDRAVAVWVATGPRGAPVIRGEDITARGRVAGPYTVAARDVHRGFFSAPGLAAVPGGGVLAAWQVPVRGGRGALRVAVRAAAADRFSAVRAVTTGAHGHDTGEFRLNTSGRSVLLATAEAVGRGPYRAVVRRWAPHAGFSRARYASPGDAFDPFAAAGARRTGLSWHADGDRAQAATAAGSGRFGAPVTLSSRGLIVQSGSGPFLAIDSRGVALAAWTDYGGPSDLPGEVEIARLAVP